MRKKSRKLFKEPQGFREDKPLTLLAKALQPRFYIKEVKPSKYGGGMEVVVCFRKDGKDFMVFAHDLDELGAFMKAKADFEGRGYVFAEMD